MNLLVLNTNENSNLLNILYREYITDRFSEQVHNTIVTIQEELNADKEIISLLIDTIDFYKTYVYVIDKIFLDNVFKYAVFRDTDTFIRLINNNTFSMDININPFYINQLVDVILKHINLTEEEVITVTYIITSSVMNIISQVYQNNAKFINYTLLNIFNYFFEFLGHINPKYYKFELDKFYRPILIYLERDKDEFVCN